MNHKNLESRNPRDGRLLREYSQHSDDELGRIIGCVEDAQHDWGRHSLASRVDRLRKIADGLRDASESYARCMTEEMGKPIKQGRAEIEKCAWVCEYYADNAHRFLAPVDVETSAKRSAVVFRPLGVVLAIMPWNFPFWQAFRFAAPAIAAGNGVVLKHAANVSGCALAIEEVCQRGLGEDILRTLLISSSRVAGVIGDARISAVTFTGSVDAGRKVAREAGSSLKKIVLELGGSDPYIVLNDADIESAARICAAARLVNAGQSCIAAKRFIVEQGIVEEFTDALAREMSSYKVGDPMLEETDVGPLARPDLVDELEQQVLSTTKAGAQIILGGVRPGGDGAYYPPTVLSKVEPDMTAATQELFGPVAPILIAKDTSHAIEIANQSCFGLGGALFTADVEKGWKIASELIETGAIAINGQLASDPRMPFGGIKDSGYGRELGEFGIREFVNIKAVSQF